MSQEFFSKPTPSNPSMKEKDSFIFSNLDLEGGKDGDKKQKSKPLHFDFNLKPQELESYLKEYIVGQEKAIRILATKIATHFHRMAYEKKNPQFEKIVGNIKSNILMLGPTGVGKTYMIKLLADKLGVPFVKADATKFTETGYVGGDVEDLVRELVREANGEIELAEYGIIYLDEIDKIASSHSYHGPDVSRSGVQRNLLKIMEESEVDLRTPFDIASQMEAAMQAQKMGRVERKKINTKNILFVVSGAFQGLLEITKKRLNAKNLGFMNHSLNHKTKENTKENTIKNTQKNNSTGQLNHPDSFPDSSYWLQQVSQQDLIEYGFESEFIGRLPIIAILEELTEEELYQILKNPTSSVILGKKRDFKAYGIDLDFEDSAFQEMAKRAYQQKIGARSLASLCEEVLIPFETYLPSTSVKKLTVTQELAENPPALLLRECIRQAVHRITQEFYQQHSITVSFNEEAINWLEKECTLENPNPYEFLSTRLKNYEYGLKLIGKTHLEISKEILQDYQNYLDSLIKESYDQKINQKNKSKK